MTDAERTPDGRRWLLAASAAALAAVATAFFAEYAAGLEPCSLCWLQRLLMGGVLLAALAGAALWPRGRWGVGLPLLALCAGGLAAAGRHLYILANPGQAGCGMSLGVMIDTLPWYEALQEIVRGGGQCTEPAIFAGLPLPLWSLLGFALLTGLGLRAVARGY